MSGGYSHRALDAPEPRLRSGCVYFGGGHPALMIVDALPSVAGADSRLVLAGGVTS